MFFVTNTYGAVFSFKVKVRGTEVCPAPRRSNCRRDELTDAAAQTPIRVLVVDDEPLAREKIRGMAAADPEIRVIGECTNGAEAIEAIQAMRPDLILLDVQMPEVGGFAVLEALKDEGLPPVIFITAYDHYAVRAFEVHALDYLLKPFDRERFKAAIERAKRHCAARTDKGADALQRAPCR